MNKNSFYTTKEKLFLGILFIAALVSLFFFISFRTLAFPEHTIQFDITREQAAENAKKFISQNKFNPDEFKETTVFTIDDQTKTYLEREVGVTETSQLAANDVDVWHFSTRFFKPLQQEELTVSYLPNGRISGYYREIEENARGAKLSRGLAQERAEIFLEQTIKTDLTQWSLVSGESNERPNRVDHTFVWEKNDFTAKDATYRMEVYVYGDQVGGYFEYLHVPETWLRAYEKETSNNDLAQTVAEAVMILLFGLAILVTFILEYRRNNLRLASLRSVGIITALIAIFTTLNSLPLALAGYPTTVSWEAFIGSVVLISVLGGFFQGASVMLILVAGEAKFREIFPRKPALESSWGSALRTKKINQALFVGVFAGIIFFSYELLYYFLGKSVGFWAPADINYADIHSTLLPWLYPVFIGFMAAATEEGIFRLFGIPFLKKYLKSTWVAIVITSIVWAFLHSNYPQSPWFVRGIEITFIGIVLGWLFVRFGFVAAFTAHYTFNALQTAISFYESGNLYASASSTLASLLPLVLAVILLGIAITKKGFAPERKENLNEQIKVAKSSVKQQVTSIQEIKYKPLTGKRKGILLGLSLLSLIGLWVFSPHTSLNQVPTSLGREDIIAAADKALQKRNVATDEFKTVATFTPSDISMEENYILEEEDFKTLRRVYPEKLPLAYWSVRYFKPLEKEEYSVDVLPDGQIYQIVHEIDEKAEGANLSADQAEKLVEEYLVREKNFHLASQKLVEKKTEKKENRTDHFFAYDETPTKIGKATFRTEVTVKGNEVASYTTYLKLPEAWIREQNETTTWDFVIGGLVGIFGVLIASFGFRTFLSLMREKKINFRFAYKVAGVLTVLSAIATLNVLSTFYASYSTAVPLLSYATQAVLSIVLGLVFSFFIFAVIFGMFFAMWRDFIGQILPQERKEQTHYIRDALISGYSVPVIMAGISSALTYILIRYDLLTSVPTFDTFPQLDAYFPSVSVIAEAPIGAVGMGIFIIAILLLKKYLHSWKRVLISVVLVAVLLAIPQQRTLEEMLFSLAQNLIIVSGGIIIVIAILRRNVLSYFIMLYSSLLLSSGWVLFVQSNMFFKINGAVLLICAALPLLLLIRNKFRFPK